MSFPYISPQSPIVSPKTRSLERRLAYNWYLLLGITVVSTIGLTVATVPMIGDVVSSVWPWGYTQVILLIGLISCIGLLAWHLTVQQRRVHQARDHIKSMEQDARARTRQQSARLHALLNVSRMMGAVTDPENIFKGITNTCLEIFDCQQASLMVVDKDSYDLEVKAATGHLDGVDILAQKQRIGSGIAGWVAQHRRPLVLTSETDMSQYPDLELRLLDLTAAMVVPIVTRDELVGVLNIGSRVPDVQYGDEDLRALEVFAENAGACIRFAERAEWMRKVIERQGTNTTENPDKVSS